MKTPMTKISEKLDSILPQIGNVFDDQFDDYIRSHMNDIATWWNGLSYFERASILRESRTSEQFADYKYEVLDLPVRRAIGSYYDNIDTSD